MTSTSDKKYCPELFEFNEKEKKVWRYMDLAKFMSLLEFREIYFPRGDCFEDKLEGSYSKPTIEQLTQNIFVNLSLFGISPSYNEVRELVKLINQINRLSIFINCWHMNEYESYAMWDIYSKDGKGIAIQSTTDKIAASLDSQTLNIIAGKVHYLDFESEEFKIVPIGIKNNTSASSLSISINTIYAFLHKRISFSHEREMRFISSNQLSNFDLPLPQELLNQVSNQANDHNLKTILEQWEKLLTEKLEGMKKNLPGLNVKIKPNCMNDLIEKVYISPRAPKLFNESLVKRIIGRYGLSCDVRKSDLNINPLF